MKDGDMTLVYGVLALLSVALLGVYLLWDKRRQKLFSVLFACVAAVNCGYFLLAICNSLVVAKLANALSYFGAAFSVLIMLLIVCDVCRLRLPKWGVLLLVLVTTAAFSIAASGDWCGLYYKSMEIADLNGMTVLVKSYGPLHILYTLYLFTYVLLMVGVILWAAIKRRLSSGKYVLFLMTVVLLNVLVWGVEQAVAVEFELLSVSYIITETALLLIYGLLCDYGIIRPDTGMISVAMLTRLYNQGDKTQLPAEMQALFDTFAQKAVTLSAAERRILQYYMQGYEIAEIPDHAFVSINTVKKHNRSIYQKLGVSSRDELMLYIELFRCCGRLEELAGSEEAE